MRFWDTSGVIKLLVNEPDTERARELLSWDEQMAVWWCTPVECWSALARLRREDLLSEEAIDKATANLDLLRAAWYEISPAEEVRRQARRVLRMHRLRASDALQAALSQPEVVEYGKQYGLEVKPSTAAQLAQMLKADADQWRGLIKQTGFTAES